MIQDYRLLGYNLPHNLEETVQNYIKQGWQPYGSPFIDGDHYYQAIVFSEAPKLVVDEPVVTASRVYSDAATSIGVQQANA